MAATGVVGIRTNAAKIKPVMAPALHRSQNSRQNNRFFIIALETSDKPQDAQSDCFGGEHQAYQSDDVPDSNLVRPCAL